MYICFAEPNKQYDCMFNKLAAWTTGGRFCHVVVVFEIPLDERINYIECCVQKTTQPENDYVILGDVEDFDGWTCYHIKLSEEKELASYMYAVKFLVGKPYDRNGILMDFTLCRFLPFLRYGRDPEDTKMYCSRLTMKLLHEAGVFLEHTLEKISPNDIYHIILGEIKKGTQVWTDESVYAPLILSKRYVFY